MFDTDSFSGVIPVMFADNPATAEVAFLADGPTARRDVDRMMRVLFQPETVSGIDAIELCRRPRAGEAVYAYKLANLASSENPAPRVRAEHLEQATENDSSTDSQSVPGPSKKIRLEVPSDSGTDSLSYIIIFSRYIRTCNILRKSNLCRCWHPCT